MFELKSGAQTLRWLAISGIRRTVCYAAFARSAAARLLALSLAFSPTGVRAQQSFSDPEGSGPIIRAVSWLQGTLLGTVATTAAVIAVATVGFMMLTGRMNWRYGATVILGCFILFGAAAIVGGIQAAAGGGV